MNAEMSPSVASAATAPHAVIEPTETHGSSEYGAGLPYASATARSLAKYGPDVPLSSAFTAFALASVVAFRSGANAGVEAPPPPSTSSNTGGTAAAEAALLTPGTEFRRLQASFIQLPSSSQ
jgi:hypothetical protein